MLPGAGQAFKAVEVNSQVTGSSGDCLPADLYEHESTRWVKTSKSSCFLSLLFKKISAGDNSHRNLLTVGQEGG